MSDKREIRDEELDNVTGGVIKYTWDGNQGRIGIGDNYNFILVDMNAYGEYYSTHKGTISDKQILRDCLARGIIRNP